MRQSELSADARTALRGAHATAGVFTAKSKLGPVASLPPAIAQTVFGAFVEGAIDTVELLKDKDGRYHPIGRLKEDGTDRWLVLRSGEIFGTATPNGYQLSATVLALASKNPQVRVSWLPPFLIGCCGLLIMALATFGGAIPFVGSYVGDIAVGLWFASAILTVMAIMSIGVISQSGNEQRTDVSIAVARLQKTATNEVPTDANAATARA